MCDDNIFKWAHSRIKRRHPEWNKVCPHCKRKSFSPLIDIHIERPVDDKNCGICDHRSSCGYKMNYTEWKEEYGHLKERPTKEQSIALKRQREKEAEQIRRQEAERKANSFAPNRKTQPPKVQAYLDRMAVLCHEMHTPDNRFMDYLYTLDPSKEKVDKAFKRYCIGSTINREIIYWQIDREGRVRTGKIMDYNPDGHRKKDKNATWVHCQDFTQLDPKEQLAPQCLFGEHLVGELIAHPPSDGENLRMAIVESEKSAIILSIIRPDILWLATGGIYNFKSEMLEVIKPFDVIVYPDADALDIWSKKVEALNSAGYHLCIPLKYQEMCTPEARAKKWDLVDMMLGKSKKNLIFSF